MSPRSILIVKPSSFGDIVHTVPAVAQLKQRWPEAVLRWVVNPEWAPLLEGNPDIDELIIFPRRELGRSVGKTVAWFQTLRQRYRSDLVVDFQCLLRSAVIGRAAVAPGGTFWGMSDAREGARFFYHQIAPVDAGAHAVDRYLAVVRALGVNVDEPLQWRMPEGIRPEGVDLTEPFLLLHPFSRGAGKSLSVADVERFCTTFSHPVVLAGRADVAVDAVDRLPNVTNLLNETSIAGLIWLLRAARWVVSVDSGPMHIAAALGKPLLSIHTWSDPRLVGPYDASAWIWKDNMLFRRGEMNHPGCKHRTCPDIQAAAAFVREQFGES